MAGVRHLADTHAADEHVALPLRQLVAGVERHARYGDRRHPEDERLLEAIVHRLLRLARTWIGAAVADDRPAVVRARLQDVDLVAAVGAVLVLPDFAGVRIGREAERAAMAERVDFRPVAGLADER